MYNYYKSTLFKKALFFGRILLVFLLIFTAFKIAVFLSPFVLAVLFSMIVDKIACFLNSKVKLPKKISTAIALMIVFTIVVGLISLIVTKLILEIYSLSFNISTYAQEIRLWIDNLMNFMNKGTIILDRIPEQILNQLKGSVSDIISMATSKISVILNNILSFITSLPNVVIYFFVTVIATVFMSLDKQNIILFVEKQLPASWLNKIYTLKNDLLSVAGGYLKAQAMLITICFFELLTGLNLFHFMGLNVQYPLTSAIIICAIDAFPILGAGAFMIPWIIVSLIIKDFKTAVALLILYVIITAVRQLLEPKLYSRNIGVHPLITLLSMYTGLKLAGFIGIIMGPAVVIILKNVFHEELEIGFFKGMFGKKEKINAETEKNNTNA
ncbi:MAG: sporulation integral membrane protein YtvI [Fusobacteriales bacterium]|nr:sporulation integral membrane protein YtvI [Fusobacteriales bacterium]